MSAAEVLAAAFFDDPMFVFIEPDNARRRRMLPWFFGAAARLGRRFGRIDLDSRLIAAVLAEAKRAGQECYLETLEAKNLPFYERRGFVVAEHVHQLGQPEFWTMVRRG